MTINETKLDILFVDDEANILSGLRRMLRGQRRTWNMNFESSGASALEWLAENNCDIVISDMRMPCMDGAQLLTAVKERYPATTRMVLSGQSEIDSIMRAITCSHQFLSKPSSPDRIKAVISSAATLRERLNDPRNQELAQSVGSLPTPVQVMGKLERALRVEHDLDSATKVVAHDPALAAKVLQLVNSSYFGTSTVCVDPIAATQLLGIDHLNALFRNGVFETASDDEALVSDLGQFAQEVSATAFRLACQFGLPQSQAVCARSAGLLHLAAQLFDGSTEFSPVTDAQQVMASGYILGVWGVPLELVNAIARCFEPIPEQGMCPAAAVHLARSLVARRQANPLDLPIDESLLQANSELAQKWEAFCESECSVATIQG